jgi:hypothetical protein
MLTLSNTLCHLGLPNLWFLLIEYMPERCKDFASQEVSFETKSSMSVILLVPTLSWLFRTSESGVFSVPTNDREVGLFIQTLAGCDKSWWFSCPQMDHLTTGNYLQFPEIVVKWLVNYSWSPEQCGCYIWLDRTGTSIPSANELGYHSIGITSLIIQSLAKSRCKMG